MSGHRPLSSLRWGSLSPSLSRSARSPSSPPVTATSASPALSHRPKKPMRALDTPPLAPRARPSPPRVSDPAAAPGARSPCVSSFQPVGSLEPGGSAGSFAGKARQETWWGRGWPCHTPALRRTDTGCCPRRAGGAVHWSQRESLTSDRLGVAAGRRHGCSGPGRRRVPCTHFPSPVRCPRRHHPSLTEPSPMGLRSPHAHVPPQVPLNRSPWTCETVQVRHPPAPRGRIQRLRRRERAGLFPVSRRESPASQLGT